MTSRSFCQTLSYEDPPGSVIRLLNELQGSSLEKSWKEVRLAAMYKPASTKIALQFPRRVKTRAEIN